MGKTGRYKKTVSLIIIFTLIIVSFVNSFSIAGAAVKPSLTSNSRNILIGGSYDFNVKNKIAGSKYQWSTSNKKIAAVDKMGVVRGLKKGSATITCKIGAAGKTYTLKAAVNIIEPAASIKIHNKIKLMEAGDTYDLNSTLSPKSSNDKTTWSTSKKSIASVDQLGNVKALKAGTVTITAVTLSGAKDSVKIEILSKQDLKITSADLINGTIKISNKSYRNVFITGDVMNSKVVLENVKIKGSLYIENGMENSISILKSNINNIELVNFELRTETSERLKTPVIFVGEGSRVKSIKGTDSFSVQQSEKAEIGGITIDPYERKAVNISLLNFRGDVLIDSFNLSDINLNMADSRINKLTVRNMPEGSILSFNDSSDNKGTSNIDRIQVETNAKLVINVRTKEVIIEDNITSASLVISQEVDKLTNMGTGVVTKTTGAGYIRQKTGVIEPGPTTAPLPTAAPTATPTVSPTVTPTVSPTPTTLPGEVRVKSVYPVRSTGVISNPGKGWLLFSIDPSTLTDEVLELGTVGYQRFDWKDIEPLEGQYNWYIIDNMKDVWASKGKQFAFRIMAANSHGGEGEAGKWVTPKWVFDAGAKYDLFKVTPSNPYDGTQGDKAIPVWNDPVFGQKVKKLVQAMAERYDGDPDIAFIDLGTYGNWGEQHLHPFGGEELTDEELQEHIGWYKDAFKKTRISVVMNGQRYAKVYEWAADNGLGLRRDGIMGDSPYGEEAIKAFDKVPAVFEWHRSYTDMVSGGYWSEEKFWTALNTGRPTFQGTYWHQDANTMYQQVPELMKEAANQLGYHFVLNSAVIPESISLGNDYWVQLEWTNEGLAPIYEPAYVAFALLDDNNHVVSKVWAAGTDSKSWRPYLTVAENAKIVFENVATGEYQLAVGLFADLEAEHPAYNLAIEGKTENKWYPLDRITINADNISMTEPELAHEPILMEGKQTEPSWINEEPQEKIYPPMNVAAAIKGTPTIDGIAEEMWAAVPVIKTERWKMPKQLIPTDSSATAEFKVMWDADNLYVFAEATDPVLSAVNEYTWEQDSVEVFVDEDNSKKGSYDANDYQLRINYNNEISGKAYPEQIQSVVVQTDKGYNVEFKIPFKSIRAEAGMTLGFDAQINDDSGTGKRETIASWNEIYDEASGKTSVFGEITLLPEGLTTWLRADAIDGTKAKAADGTSVESVKDLGKGINAIQTNADQQPKLYSNIINGKSVLRFDGVDDYFSIGSANELNLKEETTIFVIAKSNGYGDSAILAKGEALKLLSTWEGPALWIRNEEGINKGAKPVQAEGFNPAADWHLLSGVYSSGSGITLQDNDLTGTEVQTGAIRNEAHDLPYTMGGGNFWHDGEVYSIDKFFEGDIAEILIFNKALTSQQVSEINNYFKAKYFGAVIETPEEEPLDYDKNLVENGDFESGDLTGWSNRGGTTMNIAVTNEAAHSGNYGIKVSERTGSYQSAEQNITELLKKYGKGMYDVSAFVKLAEGSDSTYITITIADTAIPNADPHWGAKHIQIRGDNIGNDWTEIKNTVNLSWDGELAGAWITIETASSTADLNFDDVVVKKYKEPEAEPVSIADPGFENGTTQGWIGAGGTTIEAVTTDFHTGDYSLKVSGRTAPWHSAQYNITDYLRAKGPGMYDVSVFAKFAEGSDMTTITVKIVDSAIPNVAPDWGQKFIKLSNTVGTDWTEISGELELSWDGELTQALIFVESASSTADMFIDDITIQLHQEPEPVQNLVSNGDFESGDLTGWNNRGGSKEIEVTNAEAHNGAYSMKVSERTASYQSAEQNITQMLRQSGKGTYEVRGFVKLAEGSDRGYITIILADSAIPNTAPDWGAKYIQVEANNIGTEWTEILGTVELTWGGELTGAYITVETGASITDLYFDSISIIKK